ncbi:MAG: competence/damage-inducible protein A [Gemmatimonadales bacterium]
MNVELLTIGTELLLGFTIDTNAAHIARALSGIGVRVVRRATVYDRREDIRDAVREALARTGVVITTGGLGPTRDDVTKRVVADLYDAPLEFDEGIWQALVERFARMGRVAPAGNRLQAEVPRGATVLPNRWGTAPGLWLEGTPGVAILLPGVPREMRMLLEHEVAPRLAARSGDRVIRSRMVRTSGIPESLLAERLGDIEERVAPLTLAYLPGYDGVDLRLTAWDAVPADADAVLAAGIALLRERAGDNVYGEDDADLAAVVLEAARQRRVRIAVAESCTGGLVGKRLTDTPGSSDVFVGGVIAYDNTVKLTMLEVPAEVLDAHGAVSGEVAGAMALGAARRFGVPLAVAVTGVAGPGGGSEAKPVGTVWLATSLDGVAEATRVLLPGSRAEIRMRAAQAALLFALRRLIRSDG